VGRCKGKYKKKPPKIDWIPKTYSKKTMGNKLNYGVNKEIIPRKKMEVC